MTDTDLTMRNYVGPHGPTRTDAQCNEAYKMGRDAAMAAASWVADGNTSTEHIRRMIGMYEDGDPQLDDFLPPYPNLSGEWADSPTPRSLFEDVTGFDAHAEASWNADAYNAVCDAIAEAWEQGVSEHFSEACETELRKWLPKCEACEKPAESDHDFCDECLAQMREARENPTL